MTELTFAILKYGLLALLWVFVWLAMRSLHKDMETFSPRTSRTHRRKERRARKAAASPAPVATSTAVPVRTPVAERARQANNDLTLLVIIDGPLAGASVPLTGGSITLGRAASNTVVLEDEFASSHHARVYKDPVTGSWAIEDLGSTNGTVVNGQRINTPTILAARVPVRIGATTFELR